MLLKTVKNVCRLFAVVTLNYEVIAFAQLSLTNYLLLSLNVRRIPGATHPGLIVDSATDEDVLQSAFVSRAAASRAPEVTVSWNAKSLAQSDT